MRIKAVEGIKAYNRGSDLWSCVRPSVRPSVGLPLQNLLRLSVCIPVRESELLSADTYRLSHFLSLSLSLSLVLSWSLLRPHAGVLAKIIRRRKLHLSLFEWNAEEIKTLY